jgi:hypothetical protein
VVFKVVGNEILFRHRREDHVAELEAVHGVVVVLVKVLEELTHTVGPQDDTEYNQRLPELLAV